MQSWWMSMPLVVVTALGCGPGGKEVASVNVGAAEKERRVSFILRAGKKYAFGEDFAFDQSGVAAGRERKHCYRWDIQLFHEDRIFQALECVPFMPERCVYESKSGGAKEGRGCHIFRCTADSAGTVEADVRVKLRESACTGGTDRVFHRDVKLSKLVFKVYELD